MDDDGVILGDAHNGSGNMSKKIAGAGMAIGLIVGAGAGLILEMAGSAGASSGASGLRAAVVDSTTDSTAPADTTAPADPNSSNSSTDAPAPVKPDPGKHLQEILQPLIDNGTITQAQADKVIAAIEAARPIGPMGGRGGHRGLAGPIGFGLDVVAKALGVTADEVKTALESGQSLADLAVSKGKTAQDVIDAVVAEATTKINEKVTAGDLTQAQADKILAEVTARAGDFVNMKLPAGLPGLPGFPGLGGRGFGHGFGGPGFPGDKDGDNDDAPADTTPSDTQTTVTG